MPDELPALQREIRRNSMNEISGPEHSGEETSTRREFLKTAIGVLASLTALVLGIPFIGSLFGSAKRRKSEWSRLAEVGSLPENLPVELKFRSSTEDAYHHGDVLYSVWVVRHAPDRVTVFSPICPHLGCHFLWDHKINRFACPCHASVYSIDGKVLYGPAPRPLDALPSKIDNGVLYVKWERFKPGIAEKSIV
jgi:menaquinol-cytochrome c reductase iron-sulfur subunit